jgi:hypothetical protein
MPRVDVLIGASLIAQGFVAVVRFPGADLIPVILVAVAGLALWRR